MSLPVWGQLEKSADDPTTITEEIENLIDAHNDESDAHLGAAQALGQHKGEEVIDHPAGSVLNDKRSFNEDSILLPGLTLDAWDTVANEWFVSELSTRYFQSSDDAFVHDIESILPFQGEVTAFSNDALIQFNSRSEFVGSGASMKVRLLGFTGTFGLNFTSTGVKIYVEKDSGSYTSSEYSYDVDEWAVFRLSYNASADTYQFFDDGVLAIDFTPPSGSYSGSFEYIRFRGELTSAGSCNFDWNNLLISRLIS